MILVTMTDGVTTERVTSPKSRSLSVNSGYKKDGIFYKPELLSSGGFSISADRIERMYDGSIGIEAEMGRLFNSRDIAVTVILWNEKKGTGSKELTVFNGRGFLKSEDKDVFAYQLKTDKGELGLELLDRAPDIKQTAPASDSVYFDDGNVANTYLDKRLFPVALGRMKYTQMFPLTIDGGGGLGEYFVDGSVFALYDGGQPIRYEQHALEYRVMQNNASRSPVYDISMDIDGGGTTAKSNTTAQNIVPAGFLFNQDTAPDIADEVLRDGMVWVNSENNKEYRWDGLQSLWVEIKDTIQSENFTTIASGVGFRLKSEALETSEDPTIFGAYIKGGTIEGTNFTVDNLKVVAEGYPNNYGKVIYSDGESDDYYLNGLLPFPVPVQNISSGNSSVFYSESYSTGLLDSRKTSSSTKFSITFSGTIISYSTSFSSIVGTIWMVRDGGTAEVLASSNGGASYNGAITYSNSIYFYGTIVGTYSSPTATIHTSASAFINIMMIN